MSFFILQRIEPPVDSIWLTSFGSGRYDLGNRSLLPKRGMAGAERLCILVGKPKGRWWMMIAAWSEGYSPK
jgi:hypothetical protein